MVRFAFILILLPLLGCGRDDFAFKPLPVEPFGKPFYGKWSGEGKILGRRFNDAVACGVVETTLEPVAGADDKIRIGDTLVKCSDGREMSVRGRTVWITNKLVYDNDEKVGMAASHGGWFDDEHGRWFTVKADVPVLGADQLFMSFQIWIEKGKPLLSLDIDRQPDGAHSLFISYLKPADGFSP